MSEAKDTYAENRQIMQAVRHQTLSRSGLFDWGPPRLTEPHPLSLTTSAPGRTQVTPLNAVQVQAKEDNYHLS